MVETRLSRRQFLKGTAVAASALILSGCGATPTPTPTPKPVAPPTATPVPPTATPAPAKPVTLQWWSHWAEEENKKNVLIAAAKRFSQANPNVTVEFTWWQKAEMFAALRNAFTAGKGFPDIFYFDRGALEFIPAGWLADLTTAIDWKGVEDWAKVGYARPGPGGKDGIWAMPLEAGTDEIYFNKEIFEKQGIAIPANYQFTTDEFYEICKKLRAAGIDPFANAVGDATVMGSYLNQFTLCPALGTDDLTKLYKGEKSWKDSDVVAVMSYVQKLINVPCYPATFATMKLAESHVYFHTHRKAAMFLCGTWYAGRAFVAPEKGGQPKDFKLGMLRYPAAPNGKGNDVHLAAVTAGIAVAEKSPNKELALKLLQGIATTETGTAWLEATGVPTGLKTSGQVGGQFTSYFEELAKVHKGAKLAPIVHTLTMPPKLLDAYHSVLCSGWPLGQIKMEDALAKLEEARLAK